MAKSPWNASKLHRTTALITSDDLKKPPGGYYHTASSAWEALGRTDALPEALDAGQALGIAQAAANLGISWLDGSGRNFSKEYPNALFGLLDAYGHLDYAVDWLIASLASEPSSSPFGVASHPINLARGLRRYLYRLDEEAFTALASHARPTFDVWVSARLEWKQKKCLQAAAFAFSRAGWCDACLNAPKEKLGNGKLCHRYSDPNLVVGALDMGLVLEHAVGQQFDFDYIIYDLVQTHGAGALPLLEHHAKKPTRSHDVKRLADAIALARAL